jgi:TolA-binding protein
MQIHRKIRNRLLVAGAFAMVLAPAGVPAHAVSKDMIALQTQVQQLMDMVQRLQSTLDSHFAVMQNLAQQTADQAKQMGQEVTALQQKLDAETQTENGKVDTVSGQVQSLNDSVDELKSRIGKLDQSIQSLQTQLQSLQQSQANSAAMAGTMPGAASGAPGMSQGSSPAGGAAAAPGADQLANSGGAANPAGSQMGAPGATPGAMNTMPAAMQAPPLKETFQGAMRDFNAGRYQLAASEFGDVVHYYPLDDMAGTSQFYLGEIAYEQKHYENAINDYNAVLEGFSGNAKAPTAQLHKGLALLALNKRQEGIDELRELIRRHPQTPEAARARSKLVGMRVSTR